MGANGCILRANLTFLPFPKIVLQNGTLKIIKQINVAVITVLIPRIKWKTAILFCNPTLLPNGCRLLAFFSKLVVQYYCTSYPKNHRHLGNIKYFPSFSRVMYTRGEVWENVKWLISLKLPQADLSVSPSVQVSSESQVP